jgi:hypothetical protein
VSVKPGQAQEWLDIGSRESYRFIEGCGGSPESQDSGWLILGVSNAGQAPQTILDEIGVLCAVSQSEALLEERRRSVMIALIQGGKAESAQRNGNQCWTSQLMAQCQAFLHHRDRSL